jgi:hypothetical protein
MTPTFWTWATEHWFLTFILTLLALRIVSKTLKALLSPLERFAAPKPEEETAAVQTTEDTETEEEDSSVELADESEKDVEAVVVPVRSRLERI